jgi:hypothetical protein
MSYLHNKTVYVVGAGASCEVKLPSGLQLRDKIAEVLDFRYGDHINLISGDGIIFAALRRTAIEPPRDLTTACRHIREGMLTASSIDDYIDSQAGDNTTVRLFGNAKCKPLIYRDTILQRNLKSAPTKK